MARPKVNIVPVVTTNNRALVPREQERASCVETATRALVQRGRVSELMREQRRRSTAYTYRRAWVDFAAFLGWRLGDWTVDLWARSDPVERKTETRRLLAYLDDHVGAAEVADVQAYIAALLQRPIVDRRRKKKVGLENATINLRLAALRHLFRTAVRMGLRSDNPADPEHVDRRRVTSPYSPDGLRAGDAARLLDALGLAAGAPHGAYLAARDHVLVLLLLRLGLRREEACELRAEAVVEAPPPERGLALDLVRKGDRRQTILLPEDVAEVVTRFVERWGLAGYLFVACPMGETPGDLATAPPLRPDDVTRLVRTVSRIVLGRAVSPHALRHTFVTAALDAGSALHEVQRFVGHASPATTERYIDRRVSRAKSPAERIRY
jgi:integrase